MSEPPPNPYAPPATRSVAAPPTSAAVLCVRCGYDLTGSAVGGACPECGSAVTESLRAGGHTGAVGPTSGYAVASLVLGILSLVSCSAYGLPSLLLGPLALIFASLAKRQVGRGEAGGSSLGLAKAGQVCGIVSLCLAGAVWVVLIGLFGLMWLSSL